MKKKHSLRRPPFSVRSLGLVWFACVRVHEKKEEQQRVGGTVTRAIREESNAHARKASEDVVSVGIFFFWIYQVVLESL